MLGWLQLLALILCSFHASTSYATGPGSSPGSGSGSDSDSDSADFSTRVDRVYEDIKAEMLSQKDRICRICVEEVAPSLNQRSLLQVKRRERRMGADFPLYQIFRNYLVSSSAAPLSLSSSLWSDLVIRLRSCSALFFFSCKIFLEVSKFYTEANRFCYNSL